MFRFRCLSFLFSFSGTTTAEATTRAWLSGRRRGGRHISMASLAHPLFLAESSSPFARILSGRWAVTIGRISFPLYLLHVLVLCSAGAAVLVASSNILPDPWPRLSHVSRLSLLRSFCQFHLFSIRHLVARNRPELHDSYTTANDPLRSIEQSGLDQTLFDAINIRRDRSHVRSCGIVVKFARANRDSRQLTRSAAQARGRHLWVKS